MRVIKTIALILMNGASKVDTGPEVHNGADAMVLNILGVYFRVD